jgi:hypothetical protein
MAGQSNKKSQKRQIRPHHYVDQVSHIDTDVGSATTLVPETLHSAVLVLVLVLRIEG